VFSIIQAVGWLIWFLLAASGSVALIIGDSMSCGGNGHTAVAPEKVVDACGGRARRPSLSRIYRDSPLGACSL
jgi:hypothetical protein